MSMSNPYGSNFGQPTFASAGQTPPPAEGATPEKRVTRRVISRYTRLAIVAAIILGLLGFFALSSSTAPSAYVARTATAVPAQTAMGEAQIEVVAIDAEFVEAGAVTGDDQEEVRQAALDLVSSGRTVVALPAGRQLHPSDFSNVPTGANGLAADERIVAVTASVDAAAGGTIKSGDRVDVFGATDDGVTTLAGLVLADVEVIAILPAAERLESAGADQTDPENRDKTAGELLPSQPIPGTYLLRVKASDAARVFAVVEGGSLYLSLRGADADGTVPFPTGLIAVLCGTAPGSPVATATDATTDPLLAEPQLPVSCTDEPELFDPDLVVLPSE